MCFTTFLSILDCVQCQQCKLHGKMAMLGYSTALKILFQLKTLKLQNTQPIFLRRVFVDHWTTWRSMWQASFVIKIWGNVQYAEVTCIGNVASATRGYVSELGERDAKVHCTMIRCLALLDVTFLRCTGEDRKNGRCQM